eukprot:CAMPEP_0172160324 /NCGR_PEP_ID=MMETSP1050-20130122/5497_1 /TAXON_ID=233186 /ORGANISM="Cryptomonas curvata, Strain CCAP979/52" /LENGTH=135 /DNA_ID=CAMNT_0012830079 /DNA_START=132 /DNA_END=536 /DNA_ORIENTATION=-
MLRSRSPSPALFTPAQPNLRGRSPARSLSPISLDGLDLAQSSSSESESYGPDLGLRRPNGRLRDSQSRKSGSNGSPSNDGRDPRSSPIVTAAARRQLRGDSSGKKSTAEVAAEIRKRMDAERHDLESRDDISKSR